MGMAPIQRRDGCATAPLCPAQSWLSVAAVGAEEKWQEKATASRRGVGAGRQEPKLLEGYR